MIETILIPSARAAVLIGGLFLLRWCLGNRISPAMRHAFWGLVPLALLPFAFSSPVSVYNLLPHVAGTPVVENESRERNEVEQPDCFAGETTPPLCGTPPREGNYSPPSEGYLFSLRILRFAKGSV
jgi:hypothetical protein